MDEREANKYRYQLAVTLQDMAFLKIEMGNYDDALLHLRETENMLRAVVSEEGKVTQELREAAEERNL